MINDYKEFKKFINELSTKPKLLLHACCGPCSTHTLDLLNDYFDITVYYANDNIDTIDEFNKRILELKKVINYINKNIKLVIKEYENKNYYEAVKGHEHDGEFSKRCYNCMELRLEQSAKYAKDNNFDYFTTTLSISPYKSTKDINEIGYRLSDKYNINYLYSDFKKEDGYKHSIKMSYDLCLYRQDYCGCIYSKVEHQERLEKNENNN